MRSESRLLPVATILVTGVVFAFLPGHYHLLPAWVPTGIALALVTAIAAAALMPARSAAATIERAVVVAFTILSTIMNAIVLAMLMLDMASHHSGLPAASLLSTAVGIWLANLVVFALAYWQLDRGGPAGRSTQWQGRADFSFARGDPQDGVPKNWQPAFADYLFLAFTTSSAFSPTDTLPLTERAKMLMMTQSSISLVTVVAVAARAINILGS